MSEEYEKRFAENLKRMRKMRGLTQKAIADAIGYSEKTISKWECASSIPDIGSLFAIAGFFGTTVEALFYDDQSIYYLGIDGGGTKTALLLTDETGNVIRREYAAACNPMDIGYDRAKEVLKKAIDEICRTIPTSSIIMFAGIAGAGSDVAKQEMNRFFSTFGFRAYDNGSDNLNILEAGLGTRNGITVIIGTGICAFAKCGDVLHRIGGWGYLVDRGGSGFNLGQDALDAYYSAYDGTGNPTVLSELIEQKTECLPEALVGQIYKGGKTFVASFAPLVTEAFLRGDTTADEILERNASCVVRMIMGARRHFNTEDGSIPVVLCGGLSRDTEYVSRIKRMLQKETQLCVEILNGEPVLGAAMLARKLENTGE